MSSIVMVNIDAIILLALSIGIGQTAKERDGATGGGDSSRVTTAQSV